jgi:hypothetical protein
MAANRQSSLIDADKTEAGRGKFETRMASSVPPAGAFEVRQSMIGSNACEAAVEWV